MGWELERSSIEANQSGIDYSFWIVRNFDEFIKKKFSLFESIQDSHSSNFSGHRWEVKSEPP